MGSKDIGSSRDPDIPSEMTRSTASGVDVANTGVINQRLATKDADIGLSEQATSLGAPRPTRSDGHAPDGSIRYRVAALIAMLLLALGSLAVWYYFR